jgi:hypothetical protein
LAIECDESGHYRDIMKNNHIKSEIEGVYFLINLLDESNLYKIKIN